jgi:hypothetical protein
MNTYRANFVAEQPLDSQSSAITNTPAVTHIDQIVPGANQVPADAPLKCVDVMALVMLDSCLGG